MPNFEVVLNGSLNEQDMLSVLHYEGSQPNPTQWQAIADYIRGLMVTDLQPVLVSECEYSGITVREDVLGAVGVEYVFTSGLLVGSSVNTDVANQMCVNVKKLTSSGSRPARGRVFQGGISTVSLTGTSTWDTALLGSLDNFWTAMITLADAAFPTLSMVIKASNPIAPNTVPYNPVTSIAVGGIPVTQRRRKQGVGS